MQNIRYRSIFLSIQLKTILYSLFGGVCTLYCLGFEIQELKMKRSLLVFMILPIIAGCAAPARSSYNDVESREPVPVRNVKTMEAQKIEYSSNTQSTLTFLDTLNRGKEVSLSEDDVAVLNVGGSAPSASPVRSVEVNEPRFRVQILASGQIDVARQEKIRAETSTGLPVFLSSEQALFKLYVGEFQTRDEAEAVLPEIRKTYRDAWIVRK